MRIVNYSNFINEAVNHDALAQSVEDCLVELGDDGFEVLVRKTRNNFSGIRLDIGVKKHNFEKFKISLLKDSFDVLVDLLDDGYTYNFRSILRVVEPITNYEDVMSFDGNYLSNPRSLLTTYIKSFTLQVTNIKGIRSYESVEYSEDKILQEVDELLVELSDINFEFSRNFIVKDGKNILELWIEREQPDFETDEEYDDWYYDKEDIFTIGEVFEPLALLTDWMREKYSADLVDDGINSDTFTFDGTMNDSNAEVFDPEWKELQRKWFGENYLKKRVSALFVKYVW
jgi:hypothetical protein